MPYVTVIFSKHPKLLKVCEQIAEKDKSFIFETNEGTRIYSDTKNRAYKRAVWLRSKLPELNLHFEVVQEPSKSKEKANQKN